MQSVDFYAIRRLGLVERQGTPPGIAAGFSNYGDSVRAKLSRMKDEHDDVWRWSAAFKEVVERLIREPQSAALADWRQLRWWRRDIEEARDLYKQECPEGLRRLYDYWRIIAPDDPE